MNNLISIIIPNYNGLARLKSLLPTIKNQSGSEYEAIVVDNGSDDGSVEWLEGESVNVIALGQNDGFAAACNLGAERAKGDALFFLNNDTMLDRRCLKFLNYAFKKHPSAGFFAPKMARMNERERLDGAGDMFPPDGRPRKRGAGESTATPFESGMLTPCGGAALWRRVLFEKLGGFDDDFFAYLEDVDLGFRARLAGSEGRYVPDAVVYHRGAGTGGGFDNPDVVRWVARNKIWLWIKCLPAPVMLKNAPFMAAGLVKSAAYHALRSGQGTRFLKGALQGLTGLGKMMEKRKEVQSGKLVSNREVSSWIKASRSSW